MILVASFSEDRSVIQPVVDILRKQGEQVLVYQADLVVAGKVRASLRLDRQAQPTFIYGDVEFTPSDIEAAWYRRPNVFSDEPLNKVFLIYLDRQRKACQDALWYSIPAHRWLTSPEKLESAVHQNKIAQLYIAHECGFTIPRSVVSNSWEDAFDSFGQDEVILKLPNGRIFVEEKAHFFMSTVVNRARYKRLAHSIPFPGIWQEYIRKKREWRITVVGNNVFPAAIYTSERAQADWRKHQFDKRSVQFKSERPPQEIEQKCVKMLHKLGVGFGAFDIIEDERGNFIFLEVNLSGQYHWLVEQLGLAIPEAIAEELLKIKKSREVRET